MNKYSLESHVFDRIRFILIQPTHPGNIGAAARSIKNMGFSELFLVSPTEYPSEEATVRASGARDILEKAVVCTSLEEALSPCQLVFGLSARTRKIPWPMLNPEEAANKTQAFLNKSNSNQFAAFVFGQEKTGLTNAQLEKCHVHVLIPANESYPSLNLAQAVQIVSYELRKALYPNPNKVSEDIQLTNITFKQMESFYQELETTLAKINFLDPVRSPHLMTFLRRLCNRLSIDDNEMNILRGILTAIQKRV